MRTGSRNPLPAKLWLITHAYGLTVRREGTYLWYAANAEALQELLSFLYAECCTRSKAIKPDVIVKLCR